MLDNTLGYLAIGRPSGENAAGRVTKLNAYLERKPYRVESEGWETSLPILTQPDNIATLLGI